MAGHEDAERFQVESVAEWRAWLEANHERPEGVWLVTFKKGSGRSVVTYAEAVEEALCFGWIDSIPRKVDEQRTRLWFSPRKPKSAWSAVNKERVERLLADGRMAPAGLRMVEMAKETGTWTALDEVEALVVPDDLAAAFAAHPGAAEQWEGFPRSARSGILQWIAQAKRPETRAARVAETAEKAARGERANQWVRKQPGA
jgi:uncharacterized protein YdeI (YjbR/CyaY-like superfamily)